jgi:4-hydroxy-tetrahydrodipicolinate synthase
VFLFGENWACFFLLRDFVGLVEWYIENKVDGLFAVCQSSEMLNLTNEERLQLVRRVADRVNGRVPIIAGGTE